MAMLEAIEHGRIVADAQERGAHFPAQLLDQPDRLPRTPRVQVARRLVGQNQPRSIGQGASQGHALLLADRQLTPRPDLIPYLLKRMDRSFAAAIDLVNRLDAASLAQKKPLTRSLAAGVLDKDG